MRSQSITLLPAAALLALAATPADALCLLGCGGGAPTPAPGPIAGAGLAYLMLAGGYYMLRRWRKQNPGE